MDSITALVKEMEQRNTRLNERYMTEIMELRAVIECDDLQGEWVESFTDSDGRVGDVWAVRADGLHIMDMEITEACGQTSVKYLEV